MPKKKETKVERLKRQIHMILKGPSYKTPATKRHLAAKKPPGVPEVQKAQKVQKKKKAKKYKFIRTEAIEKSLGRSITQAEIKKLRGKK